MDVVIYFLLDSELTESETAYSVTSRSRTTSTSSYTDSDHTSVEAQRSQKEPAKKSEPYYSDSSTLTSDAESESARVDVRSESTPRVQPSSPAKSSTVQSSSKPSDGFSSNKAQFSSRSDTKGGNDDSSSDIPVVRPIEEPTLSVKDRSAPKNEARDQDYMDGFKVCAKEFSFTMKCIANFISFFASINLVLKSLPEHWRLHLMNLYTEEFICKNRHLHFFVFEKNEIKVLNLLGNALENFHIFTHKIKVVC
jgi:hypothetical protein